MTDQTNKQKLSTIPHSKPCITSKDRDAINTVLSTGMIAEGTMVQKFEHAVSQYHGLAGGVATSSGMAAIFLALKALRIGNGDEVIIPTYVCRAVWDAVFATGAKPVLCDIGDDWCINFRAVSPHITVRTKAIIVVHIFGIAADVASICELGIPVIENCCQAFGTRWDSRIVGTIGKLCVLSFHATKPLATGEGGMVLTNDTKLLKKLRELKQGKSGRLVIRYRNPMSDLQAALGLSQLAQYESFLYRRRLIADLYFTRLVDLAVELPYHVRERSIFYRFPLRVGGNFESLRALFDAEGIQVRRGVDSLLHIQCGMKTGNFPVAERCFSETLSLPIYPALTDEECEEVVKSCRRIFTKAITKD